MGWPVTVHLAFPPPPLVQETGRHVLHTLLLTVFIWETGQHTAWFSPCPPVLRALHPAHLVHSSGGREMPPAPLLPGQERPAGVWPGDKMVQVYWASSTPLRPRPTRLQEAAARRAPSYTGLSAPGLETVPACHQEAPPQARCLGACPERWGSVELAPPLLTFAQEQRSRNKASMEGPHWSHTVPPTPRTQALLQHEPLQSSAAPLGGKR